MACGRPQGAKPSDRLADVQAVAGRRSQGDVPEPGRIGRADGPFPRAAGGGWGHDNGPAGGPWSSGCERALRVPIYLQACNASMAQVPLPAPRVPPTCGGGEAFGFGSLPLADRSWSPLKVPVLRSAAATIW